MSQPTINTLFYDRGKYMIIFNKVTLNETVNVLPDMPILGSSNSAANKDMMSKIWTNGDTVI